MIILTVLRNHKVILKMVISGVILPDGIFRGKHGNIAFPELLFNLFPGNDTQSLVKGKPSGSQTLKVFLCLFPHIAVLCQIQFVNTVVKLFRGLFKKSLPLLNQLRHLAAVLPDYSSNDNQNSENYHSQYKTSLIKLAVHGLHNGSGILFHKQIPGELRNIPLHNKASLSFLWTCISPEFHTVIRLPEIKYLFPYMFLAIYSKPVLLFISIIGGGYLYKTILVNQAGLIAIAVFIFLQQLFQIIYLNSHSHNADYCPVRRRNLAVYKDRNPVIRPFYLVIIHVEGILQVIAQKFIVPFIFRVPFFHYAVKAIKIIVAARACRYQKHRIKTIFPLVCLQIRFCSLRKIRGIHTAFLCKKMVHQKAVMSHCQRNVYRLCKHCRQLIINSLRCQGGYLFYVLQRCPVIGAVAEKCRKNKSYHQYAAD